MCPLLVERDPHRLIGVDVTAGAPEHLAELPTGDSAAEEEYAFVGQRPPVGGGEAGEVLSKIGRERETDGFHAFTVAPTVARRKARGFPAGGRGRLPTSPRFAAAAHRGTRARRVEPLPSALNL